MPQHPTTTVAIGPRMPGWGSWEWLGADLATALRERFDVRVFEGDFVPECDVAIVVKHALRLASIESLAERCHIVLRPGRPLRLRGGRRCRPPDAAPLLADRRALRTTAVWRNIDP